MKVVLKFPPNIKAAGASLKLLYEGMQVDATQTTPEAAITTGGPNRMNFYREDGTRIVNPAFDLQIPDLSAPPATAYLSKIVTDGQVTIFIEGGSDFGYLPADRMNRLGGAMLKWQFQHGTATATEKLLVYRGGFIRFLQPRGAPGTVGTFEFWDGKGRVRHRIGSPIFGHEFSGQDDTDFGNRLASWTAKSGKTTGQAYNIPHTKPGTGMGHTPPGWWRQWESDKKWTDEQLDAPTGTGPTRKVVQGGYVRWRQDDETDPAKRYTTPYHYDGTTAHDRAAGEPVGLKFKYDMEPIPPANSTIGAAAQNRSAIQIHPDGQCNHSIMGGTAGCIGIQTWEGCNEVPATLKRFRGLKVKVELQ